VTDRGGAGEGADGSASGQADPLVELGRLYASVEARIPTSVNPDYESLVVPNGSAVEGVQRWFRFKEAFSRRLLTRVVKDAGLGDRTELDILDPFAGSGTTAVSASDLIREGSLRRARVVGYECNPFLHLVAATKLSALQRPSQTFLPLAKKVAAAAARDKVDAPAIPALAAFQNRDYFAEADLRRLLQLREAIDRAAAAGADQLDVSLARVCLGASVEPVSSLRRDGRALRYEPTKDRASPIGEFLRRAEWIDEDMPRRPVGVKGRIILGDGRTLKPGAVRQGSVDLVVFSPPYPNNIDYTEVYKLETWLLGFIADAESFAGQRLRTVYSHPSLLRTEGGAEGETRTELVDAMVRAVPNDRYSRGRRAMIVGYARDMARTLGSAFDVLRPGAQLVYVVGNSAHGTGPTAFVIAADLLLADLATRAGFDVERIEVARSLRRRQPVESRFLRESVVFARRPLNHD
jgi:SAM-dependent methyltransferase